ncbi:MAG TPA: hypothetical protein VLK33_02825 [Terriglobales bacterium]|nr:hypothetical protein [Terriglobales bacterium]
MRTQPVIWSWAILLAALISIPVRAEPIPVRFTSGLLHGFLVLKNQNGDVLADGEITQVARGIRVTNHLVVHFRDGSLNDETVVFSQQKNFQLISDHLIQKGPSFPHPLDVLITKATGQVTVHDTGDGKDKVIDKRMTLPPDVANGLLLVLLQNIRSTTPKSTVSMIATTPKPRLVKLVVTPQGQEPFTVGYSKHSATHYVIKIDIGGVAGAVAPMIGKQPPDTHVWIDEEEAAPVFIKMEGALYNEGPIWRIEMASPTWPADESKQKK